MESKFKKENVAARANDSDHNDWQRAEMILALIEIREAIDEGFFKLDQTAIETAMMFVGCKETLDSFLESRINTDKLLAELLSIVEVTTVAMNVAPGHSGKELHDLAKVNAGKKAEVQLSPDASPNKKDLEKTEKPDTPAAEENKSSDTLNLGDAGIIPALSEEA